MRKCGWALTPRPTDRSAALRAAIPGWIAAIAPPETAGRPHQRDLATSYGGIWKLWRSSYTLEKACSQDFSGVGTCGRSEKRQHLYFSLSRDIPSVRHFNFATSHLRDFSDARHFNCLTFNCATSQLRDFLSLLMTSSVLGFSGCMQVKLGWLHFGNVSLLAPLYTRGPSCSRSNLQLPQT